MTGLFNTKNGKSKITANNCEISYLIVKIDMNTGANATFILFSFPAHQTFVLICVGMKRL